MDKPTLLEGRYPPDRMLHAELLRGLASKNKNRFWLGTKKLELLAEKKSLDSRLLRVVARNLRSPDPWRRARAANLAGKFPDPRLITPLHTALAREKFAGYDPEKDDGATDEILEALAAIGSRRSIPRFRSHLDHPWGIVRYTALTELARWPRAIGLDAVISRFADPDFLVRLGVVRAIASLCRDRPGLRPRALATLALWLLRKGPDGLEYGDFISENLIDIEIRELQWLYRRHAPALAMLIARTRSRHFPLRSAAVSSLAGLCDRATAPRILRVFRKRLRAERHRNFRETLREEIRKVESKLAF